MSFSLKSCWPLVFSIGRVYCCYVERKSTEERLDLELNPLYYYIYDMTNEDLWIIKN